MISRRTFVVTATAGLLSGPLAAGAQQAGRVSRIGYLDLLPREQVSSGTPWLDEGLRTLGYIEGRNIVVERRFTDGQPERLPALSRHALGHDRHLRVHGVIPSRPPQ